MANLVGTFLSDENIRKLCPAKHLPPLTKTYGLFRSPIENGQSQAPTNPASMMRSLSIVQNIPYSVLKERYEEALRLLPNESVGVVSMNIEKLKDKQKRIGFKISNSKIIPQGNTQGGNVQIGGANLTTVAGTTKTSIESQFSTFNRAFQINILKSIRDDAVNLGLPIPKTSVLTNSQIYNLDGPQRNAYMKTIVESSGGGYDDLNAMDFMTRSQPP